MAHAIEYRRLRAPREHGQALIEPPLSEAASLIAQNQDQSQREYASVVIGEQSLAELRAEARRALLRSARGFSEAGERAPLNVPEPARQAMILSGHQPELFHPGVWFKNFVLSAIGEHCHAAPINLIIDNDTVSAPAIRVPQPTGETPLVALDDAAEELPYEERSILNSELFDSFAARVGSEGRLLDPLWRQVNKSSNRFATALVNARRDLERAHGLHTWEAPLSFQCDTPMFARFALHLLIELPRLHAIYNDAVREYRRVHRVRSKTHPVPELQTDGDWLEAPLWVWSETSPRRQPLFVRREGDRLELRGNLVTASLPLVNGRLTDMTVDAVRQMRRDAGIKLRPRALITSMYARLVLSDLFIHGIGGAKYDQVTDAIIERFFGVTPPRYMTVTATMKLFPEYSVNAVQEKLRQVEHALRELPYHPEAFVPSDGAGGECERLRSEKEGFVRNPPPKGQRKAWHQAIAAVNARLRPFASKRERELHAERERLQQQLLQHALLGSREFSFCLFDERLPEQLKQLARGLH